MSSDGYFVKLAPAETCKHTIVLISEFLSFLGKTIHNNFLDHESAWELKKCPQRWAFSVDGVNQILNYFYIAFI